MRTSPSDTETPNGTTSPRVPGALVSFLFLGGWGEKKKLIKSKLGEKGAYYNLNSRLQAIIVGKPSNELQTDHITVTMEKREHEQRE